MSSFLEFLRGVCSRPGMYVSGGTYEEIVALITGFDLARDRGVLVGFKEWLVVRVNGGNNLFWGRLVLLANFPEKVGELSSDKQEEAIEGLYLLVERFARERSDRGLRRIFLDYQQWLELQDWYGPSSPEWYEGR